MNAAACLSLVLFQHHSTLSPVARCVGLKLARDNATRDHGARDLGGAVRRFRRRHPTNAGLTTGEALPPEEVRRVAIPARRDRRGRLRPSRRGDLAPIRHDQDAPPDEGGGRRQRERSLPRARAVQRRRAGHRCLHSLPYCAVYRLRGDSLAAALPPSACDWPPLEPGTHRPICRSADPTFVSCSVRRASRCWPRCSAARSVASCEAASRPQPSS